MGKVCSVLFRVGRGMTLSELVRAVRWQPATLVQRSDSLCESRAGLSIDVLLPFQRSQEAPQAEEKL